MRGKDPAYVRGACPHGITPAYAGKRHADPDTVFRNQDHPRLCGEKFSGTLTPKTDSGSPPPMRGKVCCVCLDYVLTGITPAYAGKRK